MSDSITRRRFVAGIALSTLAAALPGWAFAEDDAAVAFARSLYALPNLWGDVTADPARFLPSPSFSRGRPQAGDSLTSARTRRPRASSMS